MKKVIIVLWLILLVIGIGFAENGEQPPEEPEEDYPKPVLEPEPQEDPVPEGCSKIETGSGMMQIKCDFDSQEPGFEEFNVKAEVENCEGRFEMINGKPACIKEGEKGLAGIVCPSQSDLDFIKSNCNGKVEQFQDPNGCTSIMCVNEEFEKEFAEKINEKFKGLKADALNCEKNSGELTMIDGEYKCITQFQEELIIGEDLGELSGEKIGEAAKKLKKIEEFISPITEKLEAIEKQFQEEGKTDEAKVFDDGAEKLKEISEKIEIMKEALEDSESLSEEERINILKDMHEIQKTVSNVTMGILEGKVITEEDKLQKEYESYDEFYGRPFTEEEFRANVEAEKDAIAKVNSCDSYSEGISFVPPDPEGQVVLIELNYSGEKCEMTLHTKDGKKAEYSLNKSTYSSFSGPQEIANEDCTGSACDFIKEISSATHGTTPEEICTEKCVIEDCNLGHFGCMEKNLDKCEKECGMVKGPDPGEMSTEEKCIFDCVSPGVTCASGEGGEQNPMCATCAEECTKYYEGPCLNDEQITAKEGICDAQCQYCYGEPVMGDSGEGYGCIVDVICGDASDEWGDDPGSGPDSWEPGHGPGEELGPPTGGVVLGGFIESFFNFIRGGTE